ncbi:hd phosphohydrolase family protein [Leishmania donovani]|nr:hd phosphohydrolase family protein [Leishmania donovani]
MSAEQPASERIPLVRRAWERCVARLLPLSLTGTPTPSSRRLRDVSEGHFRRFIYDRYTEPQRHYHTLEHLEEMLGQLVTYEAEHGWHGACIPAMVEESVSSSAPPSELLTGADRVTYEWTGTVLLLSVLFHDVVYDPTRGDNEEASAAVAAEFLQEMQRESEVASSSSSAAAAAVSAAALTSVAGASALPSASGATCAEDDASPQHPPRYSSAPPLLWADAQAIEFVRNSTTTYILKTKEHLSVEPKQPLHLPSSPAEAFTLAERGVVSAVVQQSRDDPLHVFLDLDLAILGHPDADTYRHRYADNIQREYSHYPRADFLKGRAGFLNVFAQHPQWYKTPYFFYRLEAHARHNAAQEVKTLTAELADVQMAS